MGASESVGIVVRAERKERGWSLDRAATRLGVSRRLLTQIESGSANPSLSTLLSIANGFGIDLTSLVADTPDAVDAVLQPDNDAAAVLWSTDAGSRAQLLVGMGPLEMWSWRLEPGESKRSDAHSTNSLEALIVTAGHVEVDIDGGETRTVAAGQSLIFSADVGHEYRSVGERAADFHLAVFDPIDSPAGR
ncbi:MAG: XRE family transcriptional regulator [Ilumatobacter sp.]|uniref:helix-turn-helix domain-containing protein n=1 Tax=Ilumatobacter sp. TaxID=1967498 RepID=UPI003C712C4A